MGSSNMSLALFPSYFPIHLAFLLFQELCERVRRLQVERESLESKMEAEKHVMRAQLRDLMSKQQAEVQRLAEQHRAQMDLTQHDLLGQLEEMRRTTTTHQPGPGDHPATDHRLAELEGKRVPTAGCLSLFWPEI